MTTTRKRTLYPIMMRRAGCPYVKALRALRSRFEREEEEEEEEEEEDLLKTRPLLSLPKCKQEKRQPKLPFS
jgi:hypothetical protein